MKYRSTRGTEPRFTFEQALFSGYAPDGGLFVPESIPTLDRNLVQRWKSSGVTYTEVVKHVIRLYVPEAELSEDQLCRSMKTASEKFCTPEIIPVKSLSKGTGSTIRVVELFHGTTASFKDLALSLVGPLMEQFLENRNQRLTALVGTSGDTGSAAMASLAGLSNLNIIVLYPKGMVSEVQELQILSNAMSDNAQVFEVEGTSDDLDVPIAQCFPNPNLTSVNSINWARIMMQICHYVYLYANDSNNSGPVSVVVPTGAAGNVTAGVYAKLMGVPLQLYAACNNNSTVHDMLSNGVLEMGRACVPTPANAMDICNPYNVERLIYIASNGDAATVKNLMTTSGKVMLPAKIAETLKMLIKSSESIKSGDIFSTIQHVWNTWGYVVCPHTATAVKLALDKIPGDCYVFATASPQKFPEVALAAGIPPTDWDSNGLLKSLRALPLRQARSMKKGDDWLKILQTEINQLTKCRE